MTIEKKNRESSDTDEEKCLIHSRSSIIEGVACSVELGRWNVTERWRRQVSSGFLLSKA